MGNSRANLQTSLPLSNLSIKASNIFPTTAVRKGTGKIRVYSGDNMLPEVSPAGRRSAPQEIERKTSQLSYSTERFALAELITAQDRRDADDDIADIEADSVSDQTERLLLGLEAAVITKAFTAGNFASGHTATLTNDRSEE